MLLVKVCLNNHLIYDIQILIYDIYRSIITADTISNLLDHLKIYYYGYYVDALMDGKSIRVIIQDMTIQPYMTNRYHRCQVCRDIIPLTKEHYSFDCCIYIYNKTNYYFNLVMHKHCLSKHLVPEDSCSKK